MRKTSLLLTFLCGTLLPAYSSAQGPQGEALPVPATRAATGPLDVWLDYLPPSQRMKAQSIMEEYRPKVQDLRQRIISKKNELQELSYNRNTSPDTLPRLGRELQVLRDELQSMLIHADQRMRREVGIPLGPLPAGDAAWNSPQKTLWKEPNSVFTALRPPDLSPRFSCSPSSPAIPLFRPLMPHASFSFHDAISA